MTTLSPQVMRKGFEEVSRKSRGSFNEVSSSSAINHSVELFLYNQSRRSYKFLRHFSFQVSMTACSVSVVLLMLFCNSLVILCSRQKRNRSQEHSASVVASLTTLLSKQEGHSSRKNALFLRRGKDEQINKTWDVNHSCVTSFEGKITHKPIQTTSKQ